MKYILKFKKYIYLFIIFIILNCSNYIRNEENINVAWIHFITNYQDCKDLNNKELMLCLNEGLLWINKIEPETLIYQTYYNNSDSSCYAKFKFNSDTISIVSKKCNLNIYPVEEINYNINNNIFNINQNQFIIKNDIFYTGYGHIKKSVIKYKYTKFGCIDIDALNYDEEANLSNNECKYICNDIIQEIEPMSCLALINLYSCEDVWEGKNINKICPKSCNSYWCE